MSLRPCSRFGRLFLAGLFSLLTYSAAAGEVVDWQNAPTILKTGERIRLTFSVDSREQSVVGTVAALDQTQFPDIIGVMSDRQIFHMIDLKNLNGTIERNPVAKEPVNTGILSTPEVEAKQKDNELKIRNFLASKDRNLELLAVSLRFGIFTIGVVSGLTYWIYWDSASTTKDAYLTRPLWTAHASSFIQSAAPIPILSLMDWAKNRFRLNQNNRLIYMGVAAIAAFHAVLEIKGLAPYRWTQIAGPNVPDIKDFYVGAGTAAALLGLPIVDRIAEYTKRHRALNSAKTCFRAFNNTESQ